MSDPDKFKGELVKLINVANDQLIYYYLVMYDNLLDMLEQRGLSKCAAWQRKRNYTPKYSENGFSLLDIDNFRQFMLVELLPDFMLYINIAYNFSKAMTNNNKTDNWRNFFKYPCLTSIFTFIFEVDVATVGANPDKIFQVGQKIMIFWIPYKNEIEDVNKTNYRGAEKMLKINTKPKKPIEEAFRSVSLLYNGIVQSIQNGIVAFSLLITHSGQWNKHIEAKDMFNMFMTHSELRMNPLRHKNYFPHSVDNPEKNNIKIDGGKAVYPRILYNDIVVKYIGLDRNQTVKIERDNRGRLAEANQLSLFWRNVDYTPST